MDGRFGAVSLWLRDLLRTGYTGMLAGEDVRLCSPAQKAEAYRVGVCLYDIQDFSRAVPEGPVRADQPCAMELGYLVYINEAASFGNFRTDEAHALLSRAAEVLCRAPLFSQPCGCPATARLAFLSVEEKLKLWQGFTQPLQPALYVDVAPVLLPVEDTPVAPNVHTLRYHIQHKEETP